MYNSWHQWCVLYLFTVPNIRVFLANKLYAVFFFNYRNAQVNVMVRWIFYSSAIHKLLKIHLCIGITLFFKINLEKQSFLRGSSKLESVRLTLWRFRSCLESNEWTLYVVEPNEVFEFEDAIGVTKSSFGPPSTSAETANTDAASASLRFHRNNSLCCYNQGY